MNLNTTAYKKNSQFIDHISIKTHKTNRVKLFLTTMLKYILVNFLIQFIIFHSKITIEEAFQICQDAFLNNTGLKQVIQSGCYDPAYSLEICALDVSVSYLNIFLHLSNIFVVKSIKMKTILKRKNGENFVELHIQATIDESIQNILNELPNCQIDFLNKLCPNDCSGNGECILCKKRFEFYKNII